MKVTFDISRDTKNALEDIKTRLRRKGLPAFECAIISFLIEDANDRRLEHHFSDLKPRLPTTKRKARKKRRQ